MKRTLPLVAGALLLGAAALSAHDMFLKLGSFFLPPHSSVSVQLLNGTFEESGNAISRDRMADVRVVRPAAEGADVEGAGGGGADPGVGDEPGRPPDSAPRVTHPDTSRWRDSSDTAVLDMRTGAPGTYVVGVSIRPRTFTLSGEDFDEYLRHDGVLDVLEARREAGELGTPATETYSKHAKAILQVGNRRTGEYAHRLGYPVELVPLRNPYGLGVGDTLELLFLREGDPVSGQLVYASWEGYRPEAGDGGGDGAAAPPARDAPGASGPGAEAAAPRAREPIRTRTDVDGVARIPLRRAGKWYVRLIHMERVPDDPDVDYESNWATLTFQVR